MTEIRFQEIDLYVDEFQPKKIVFSFYVMCFVILAYLSLLLVVYFSTQMAGYHYERQLKTVKVESDYLDEKLTLLRQIQPDNRQHSVFEHVEKLNLRNKELSRLIATLKRHSPELTPGFVSQLKALGAYSSDNISLDEIYFDRESGEVAFKGETWKAKNVPNYIASLSSDTVFSHSKFGMVVIYADKLESGLQFDVGNSELLNRRFMEKSVPDNKLPTRNLLNKNVSANERLKNKS